ncbi:hypothetical protein VOLCADRAFT_120594 [Volvox carteri f. nagariensis]|uniref:Uncharacterized protein n=1 Tax=Volvox carteri f. nagariensis TaxID=3068 RepID=D8TPC0_VOLCA|nr:uncharacterized protein VOLCADRAFT_120594 [Volvox carteri f. nagariensis]EFJ50734.1 hypothetical protein VOLCADRAFT_120594 [Volvox carteri f. nagariensis]|eukprot:XP_002948327.1 hypothetical protein VOLCADRAFT_120594 [Volvox carteri f. nagariensis]
MAKEGDANKGHLHKGPVSAPLKSVPGYKPVSSIPAKFETILYTGPREKKGFSTESRRFMDPDNDLPGYVRAPLAPQRYPSPFPSTAAFSQVKPVFPYYLHFMTQPSLLCRPGSYNSQPPSLDRPKPESIGKKGLGPMASQSRRFSDRVYYTGPGPTDYRRPGAAIEDKSHSKAFVTSAFQEKTTTSLVPLDRITPHLGPGAYDSSAITRTGAKVDYTSRPGATSAFKNSTGHELILSGNLEAPASTSYELGDPWAQTGTRGGGGSARVGTSSFGTSAGRGAASVGSMAATLDTLLFGAPSAAAGKPESGPGPGSYELQDYASIRAKLSRQAQRPSPVFLTADSSPPRQQPRQILVSAGEKVAHDYLRPSHAPLHSLSPGKGVSAPFRSRSAGHEEVIDQHAYTVSSNAPGPAYYQPPTAIRKSFHKNAKQQYMTVAF